MLILVTGGSGSGKSAFAESVVMGLKTRPNLYIATMYPFDEECHRRIARHRLMRRDKGFETLECYTGLKDVKIPSSGTTLLESTVGKLCFPSSGIYVYAGFNILVPVS